MSETIQTLHAFLRRDISIERSYRFNFLVKSLSVFFQLALFYFISKFMAVQDYFSFVFTGLLFSRFFQFWLGVFAENIRQEQYWGTAEAVFLSPASPLVLILASSAGKFFLLLIELAVYMTVGVYVFGAVISARIALLLPFLVTGSVAFAGLGMLSGGFIMYLKRGDPVNWFIATSFDLLSGVYFPVTILPRGLRFLAGVLPTTSALSAWRSVLLSGTSPSINTILLQLFWALLLGIAGLLGFRRAFRLIRRKGELGNY